ncbi:LLM class flavin-dependent oxidoreductase [Streptomyces sp. NPDC047461]|uniref:LLM class flavin-dependent oxidoreductase n=1 Tax=Streptomyces sp. NPDC047461 TaxID=3155619 RepID=UPI0033C9E255
MKFLAITLIVHRPDPVKGVRKSTHDRFREVLDNAVPAEELGFDGFGVGERHERPFISSSPTVVLSHMSALTRRIRLFTAVTTLSLLDPVRAYEDYATLDHLSEGRLDLIIGKGNGAAQRELFQVTPEDQWDRNAESYEVFRNIWRQDKVGGGAGPAVRGELPRQPGHRPGGRGRLPVLLRALRRPRQAVRQRLGRRRGRRGRRERPGTGHRLRPVGPQHPHRRGRRSRGRTRPAPTHGPTRTGSWCRTASTPGSWAPRPRSPTASNSSRRPPTPTSCSSPPSPTATPTGCVPTNCSPRSGASEAGKKEVDGGDSAPTAGR